MNQQRRSAIDSATRDSRTEFRAWAVSACAALLLHAGLVVPLLDFGASEVAPKPSPPAAMTVELAALPSTPEQRVTEMPPGPEQVQQQVRPRPQPKPKAFDPPPKIQTPPPPDALSAAPEPAPEAKQQAAADQTTTAPSMIAEATTKDLQAPIEGSASDSPSSAAQTWESKLLAHLEQQKRYPGSAQRRHQEDVVYLRFVMDRSGKVLNWNIERSGGYAALDEEVNALIQRASPLPPPPEEVTGASIEMVVPVEFFLSRRVAKVER